MVVFFAKNVFIPERSFWNTGGRIFILSVLFRIRVVEFLFLSALIVSTMPGWQAFWKRQILSKAGFDKNKREVKKMGEKKINLKIDQFPFTSRAVKSLDVLKGSKNKIGSEEYIEELAQVEANIIEEYEKDIIGAVKVNYYDLPYIIVAMRVLALALETAIDDREHGKDFIEGMKKKVGFLEKVVNITTISR